MEPKRRQVNLKLTAEQEKIVRSLVQRLREGGPSYQLLVRAFLLEKYEPRYMHIEELNLRFGRIESRLLELEQRLASRAELGGVD
jgi:hypothetical protein